MTNQNKEIVEAAPAGPVAPVTPMELLQIATEKGADVDQLTKLMDLQDRWNAAQAKTAYNVAMSAFRAECPIIDRTKTSHTGKYAGLGETLKQINSLLSKHQLVPSWKQDQQAENSYITVTCFVTHVDGHFETSTLSAPPDESGKKNNIQAIASTDSYLRRYTLYSVLGLASMEDDNDGNLPDQRISDEAAAELTALADQAGVDPSGASYSIKICQYFKVDSIPDIPGSQYYNAKTMLEKKVAK